ncbi:MAG: hypothetical protein WD669_05120 [Pirellulales bacterium]
MKLLVIIDPILPTRPPVNPADVVETPLIHETPWVKMVIDALPSGDGIQPVFVVRQAAAGSDCVADFIRLHRPEATVQYVPSSVQGAGCAALMAVEHLDGGELCVVQGNQFLRNDLLTVIEPIRTGGLPGGVVIFDSLNPRWPHVRLNAQGDVEEASETALISGHALAGVYYYRSGDDFVRCVEQTIRKGWPTAGGYGLASAVNEMILAGKRVGSVRIAPSDFVPLARELDLECCRSLFPPRPGAAAA